MEENLKDFLDTGKNWERIKTSTPGIFIRKMPKSTRKEASLAIELNPPDHSGKPTKKNGIFVRNQTDYKIWQDLLSLPEITKILKVMKKINPIEEEEKIFEI